MITKIEYGRRQKIGIAKIGKGLNALSPVWIEKTPRNFRLSFCGNSKTQQKIFKISKVCLEYEHHSYRSNSYTNLFYVTKSPIQLRAFIKKMKNARLFLKMKEFDWNAIVKNSIVENLR